MKPVHRRACRTIAALVLVLGQVSPSAHPVIVEQAVTMTIEQQAGLVVRLHVPAAITGDPNLARLLKGGDTAALERQLQIVAADIARNLDLRQGDSSLPFSNATATRGSDAASIDVDVRYPTLSGEDALSARLNAFSMTEGPIRTTTTYRPRSGRERVVSISGPATRMTFDPPLALVLSDSAVRGLRVLFDGGDHLLFLLCILLPIRRSKSVAAIFSAAIGGQALTIAAVIAVPAVLGQWSSAAALAAASTVVMAAVQNISRARTQWMLPVAVAFGSLNGWSFGTTAQASLQFAGAHEAVAVLTFGGILLAGGVWLGAVVWAIRTWLHDRGVSDRLLVVAGSALVAHSAMHRVMERADAVAQTGSFGGERSALWLTLIWVGVVLLAAAANAVSSAPEHAHAS